MGKNGDWKKEGYSISHSYEDSIINPGENILHVKAHKDGKQVGSAKFWINDYEGPHGTRKLLLPHVSEVSKGHRRKGIASAMYQHAERVHGRISRPELDSQTNSAQKFWDQPNRPFAKSEDLDKGIKEGATALGILSSILAPNHINRDIVNQPKAEAAAHIQAKQNIPLDPDLEHIAFIESSGGKNKHHEMTKVGLNAGHTAGGSTGLMPLTVKEILQKNPELAKRYPHLLTAPHQEVTAALNADPSMEADLANAHWARLRKVFKGNRSRMAYAWRNGIHAAKWARADDVMKHPYVQKFLMQSAAHKVANLDKSEILMKPYRSEAQRRWAHTESGKRSLGGEAAVHHWDEESKGKKLPERVKKDEGIVIPKKAFKEEHKHLLDVLEHPTKKKLKQEHDKQAKEMKEELDKTMSLGHSLGGPNVTGGAALLKETAGKIKKKLKKKKSDKGLEKALADIDDVELLFKGKVKEHLIERAEEILEKMSRPKITFPNFKKLSTRPDAEVQTMETTQQKDLYGRKVANAALSNIKPGMPFRLSGSRKAMTKETGAEAYGKRIAGSFDRRTLGMSTDTPQGPKSATLTGKLRSKFEEGDEEYNNKVEEHRKKRNEVVQQYNDAYTAWAGGLQPHRQALMGLKPDTPEFQEAYAKYQDHLDKKPQKPKLPRKPSKSRKDTKELSPEKQKLRGQAVDATIHHEALHHTMHEMKQQYGPRAAHEARKGLLSQFDPDTLQAVGSFIANRLGYSPRSPHFTEEILAHSRDILTNPTKRERFKEHVGTDNFDRHMKNLKQGHQKAYEYAMKLKPQDIGFKDE